MCLIWVCLLNAAYFLCCQLKNWHWACGPTLVYIKYYIFSMYNCLGLQIAIDPRTINLIRPELNSSKHPASVKPSSAACFFIFTHPRVSRTNPLFGFAPSCVVFNQLWWASFITLAIAHESMILGLSPICINRSNTHRFHSILQCASRVKISATRVLVRPTFFQPNSSNQLLSTFSCPICSQHFN